MKSTHRFCIRRRDRIFLQGFSLVELLVVIAVIILMIGLSAPALVSIAQGQGMKRAIGDVSGLIDQGRSEAMALSTWTWVGLVEQTSGPQQELLAVLVASKDGTTNMAPGNLRTMTRVLRIENVKVLDDLTPWGTSIEGAVPLKGSSFSFAQTVRGQTVQFTGKVIGFNSQGEATLGGGAVPPWIEVGLQEQRGNTPMTNKTASIRVSGFSGQVNVDY